MPHIAKRADRRFDTAALGSRLLLAAALLVGLAGMTVAAAPFGLADLVAPLLPTVVNIAAVKFSPAPTGSTQAAEAETASSSLGSGFFIDPGGVIVTNRHVIAGASRVDVTLHDHVTLRARVLGESACDIALLKVTTDRPQPVARFGDSDQVRVGDLAVAIGDPLGVGTSVSSGVVSGLGRDIRDGPFDDFIQTDAAINHGNSGGPLFDAKGEVIGIDTALISPTTGSAGLGFAIPSNDAQYVITQLRKHGRVRVGWLGLHVQRLTPDLAQAVGLPGSTSGVIVVGVERSGPLAGKQVLDGDVVLSYAGRTMRDARAFMRAVARSPVGSTVPLLVWRDGGRLTVAATVGEWPADAEVGASATSPPPISAAGPLLGLHLAPITDALRATYKLPSDQTGVLVIGIDPDSPADKSAVVPGNIIVKIGRHSVTSAADAAHLLAEARQRNRPYALLFVQSREGPRWVAIALRQAPG